MHNKTNFLNRLALIVISAILLIGCGDDEVANTVSVAMQQEEDSIAIAAYITDNNLDPGTLDTTVSGVIYQIKEPGSGSPIAYNDLVNLFLSVKLTDGTLLRTNIDTVLQNHNLYDSTAVYNSLLITHTKTGWALAPPENNFLSMEGFIGMREGMTAVLSEMNVGGTAMFITPSIYGLTGGSSNINNFQLQEVFVFHVYPVRTH